MKKKIALGLSDIKCKYIKKYLTGSSIIDIGAGDGRYLSWLKKENSGLELTAIDKLKSLSNQDFTYYHIDLEHSLPSNLGEYSTILIFDVIEHVDREKGLLNDIFNICAPGGIVIGSVPHDEDKFLPDYNLTFYHRSDITHKRYYTEQSLREMLVNAGFSDITIGFEGGVNPQVIAEFFPPCLQYLIRRLIGLFRMLRIVKLDCLHSDLFFSAKKIRGL
jgi:SAM-dependent methyltransferase